MSRKRDHIAVFDTPDPAGAASLQSISNVAAPGDTCAIAVRRLPAGTSFVLPEDPTHVYSTTHEILEGHRFAISALAVGDSLISWGLRFGVAVKPIAVGEYVMNSLMSDALHGRREVTWTLPKEPNFKDISSGVDSAIVLDDSFAAGTSLAGTETSNLSFMGYARGDGSAGTRNNVILLGVTAHSARFARAMAENLAKGSLSKTALKTEYPNVDGIVAVAHNEGGADSTQNNAGMVTTVMTNYIMHPNVGGAVVLCSPQDTNVTRQMIVEELKTVHNVAPEERSNFEFLELSDDWKRDVDQCTTLAENLAKHANKTKRTEQNVSKLRIALQCGGSDAFSGITGNPLVGEVAQNVVRYGGSAVLAETPELVGAESYILKNCASVEVANAFLATIKSYMEYADRHRQDASGNPSGGNLFRGLYNIALKSLGASRKKPEKTTLDGVLGYGEHFPTSKPGYYFMHSPGNDLESIAGQVATGCNLVFFVTGNGAITNFPFVPTLKVVTTTGRFNKLERDMDVNAGVLNEGITMEEASRNMLELSLKVCSGVLSKGEAAGHSQISLWRNYASKKGSCLEDLESAEGERFVHQTPIGGGALDVCLNRVRSVADPASLAWVASGGSTAGVKHFNLVLPTSICSSQIARLAAARLTSAHPDTQYCSIPHTEGCGGGGGAALDNIITRVLAGHLFHSLVRSAFILEHGCEKTHNDWFLTQIGEEKQPNYGWGSVQGDGGIESVMDKVAGYFEGIKTELEPAVGAAPTGLILAVMCREKKLSERDANVLAQLVITVVANGGSVILPRTHLSCGGVLRSHAFVSQVLRDDMPGDDISPTLSFAERPKTPGLHVMDGQHVMSCKEIMTGLAAAGATGMIWWIGEGTSLQAGHPFVPTLHVTTAPKAQRNADTFLQDEDDMVSVAQILSTLHSALELGFDTKCKETGSIDFSIPRGMTSISL